MSLHKYFERIKMIDHLIQTKRTGNILHLAQKLSLSKIGTYKFLQEMKEEGFPIAYSKKDKTYYYTKPGKIAEKLFYPDVTDANFDG